MDQTHLDALSPDPYFTDCLKPVDPFNTYEPFDPQDPRSIPRREAEEIYCSIISHPGTKFLVRNGKELFLITIGDLFLPDTSLPTIPASAEFRVALDINFLESQKELFVRNILADPKTNSSTVYLRMELIDNALDPNSDLNKVFPLTKKD